MNALRIAFLITGIIANVYCIRVLHREFNTPPKEGDRPCSSPA